AILQAGILSLKSIRNLDWPVEPKTLGEHLRKRRGELGLRQKDVADQLGVNENTVVGWERGKTPVDRHLPLVISFLGLDPCPTPRSLGQQLRSKRGAFGLSCKAAAKLLGVDEG